MSIFLSVLALFVAGLAFFVADINRRRLDRLAAVFDDFMLAQKNEPVEEMGQREVNDTDLNRLLEKAARKRRGRRKP